MRAIRAGTFVTAFFVVMGMSLSGLGSSSPVAGLTLQGGDYYIPRPVEASDQEGVYRLMVTAEITGTLLEPFIGERCTFSLVSDNKESIHLNNYAVVDTGATTVPIPGTESVPFRVTDPPDVFMADLGETVALYNIMEPDPDGIMATSVDYTLTIECVAVPPTTTPETTTTIPPETTTTTNATTTTTDGTTSTTGGSTTTTFPSTTTTWGGETTTTVPPTTGSTLPFTGVEEHLPEMVAAGVALLLLGGGALLAARNS